MVLTEIRELSRQAIAAASTTARSAAHATITTSPALTRLGAAGLDAAARCSSCIPERWTGPATPEVACSADSAQCDYVITSCLLHYMI